MLSARGSPRVEGGEWHGGADACRRDAPGSEREGVPLERALKGEHADLAHLVASVHRTLTPIVWPGTARLPAALGEGGLEPGDLEAGHGRSETAGDLGDDARVLEVGGGLDDGLGPAGWVVGLEDA